MYTCFNKMRTRTVYCLCWMHSDKERGREAGSKWECIYVIFFMQFQSIARDREREREREKEREREIKGEFVSIFVPPVFDAQSTSFCLCFHEIP
jgi:hypothetical protein